MGNGEKYIKVIAAIRDMRYADARYALERLSYIDGESVKRILAKLAADDSFLDEVIVVVERAAHTI